ncbi:MAG: anthranilate synthase component I [bacterium]
MLNPPPERVADRLEDHYCVPVYRSFVSDTLTPVSAYLNLSRSARREGFLLESVEKGDQLARYSFLGVDPRGEVYWRNGELTTSGDRLPDINASNPLDALRELIQRWNAPSPDELPDFTGGLVGYLGYEMVHYIENKVAVKPPTKEYDFSDLRMFLVDKMVIFDHVKRTIYLVGHLYADGSLKEDYRRVDRELEALVEDLRAPTEAPDIVEDDRPFEDRLRSNFERQEFQEAVESTKEYIRSGDIFQAVISQRFTVSDANHPFNLYRRLRSLNPSPYMFYLDYGEYQLVGSSPEILVQKEGDKVRVRPIAGTRRRGGTPEEDKTLEQDLLSDQKELAEHTMLVDLGRNDIGRVSNPGSVTVTEQNTIERYSHVMHMVSNVEGTLKSKCDSIDVLEAAFPAGTVTGAPKVRAMQIIEELEPSRRGPYAGAVGYISFQENLDTCIVIRTILAQDDQFHVQAGAGIVADSRPDREYEETREKAQALFQAIETLPQTDFL